MKGPPTVHCFWVIGKLGALSFIVEELALWTYRGSLKLKNTEYKFLGPCTKRTLKQLHCPPADDRTCPQPCSNLERILRIQFSSGQPTRKRCHTLNLKTRCIAPARRRPSARVQGQFDPGLAGIGARLSRATCATSQPRALRVCAAKSGHLLSVGGYAPCKAPCRTGC